MKIMYALPDGYLSQFFRTAEDRERLRTLSEFWCKVWTDEGKGLVPEQNDPEWQDDLDKDAYYWVVKFGDNMAGFGRLTVHDDFGSLPDINHYRTLPDWGEAEKYLDLPVAALTRLVVAHDFRRQGLSNYLTYRRITYARKAGAKSIMCGVPEHRFPALKKFGFRILTKPRPGTRVPELKWSAMGMKLFD